MARRKLPPPQNATRRNPTAAVVRRREGSQILHTAPDDGRFGGLHPGPLNRSCLAPCSASSRLSQSARHARERVLSFRPEVIRRRPRLPVSPLIAAKTDVDPGSGLLRPPRFRMRWRRGAGRRFTSRLCGSDGRHQSGACQGSAGPWKEIVRALRYRQPVRRGRSGRETGQMNHHPDGIVGRACQLDFQSFAWNPSRGCFSTV